MYNCEKCIHEELCDQPGRQLWGHLTKETDCSDFKDRTNYVEVVRCEDCIHCIVRYSENEAYCGHPDGLNDCLRPDDFCSYGERREGE